MLIFVCDAVHWALIVEKIGFYAQYLFCIELEIGKREKNNRRHQCDSHSSAHNRSRGEQQRSTVAVAGRLYAGKFRQSTTTYPAKKHTTPKRTEEHEMVSVEMNSGTARPLCTLSRQNTVNNNDETNVHAHTHTRTKLCAPQHQHRIYLYIVYK